MTEEERIITALRSLRVPVQQGEYDLHEQVRQVLEQQGITCIHEAPLAPRCRIDYLCGSVGIEIKKGKPVRAALIRQLSRYAACPQITALVAVIERTADLPREIGGKPLYSVCLNRLWGIAL